MFKIIEDTSDISKAQAAFEGLVLEIASKSSPVKLGYQGGGREVIVHYISSLNFWVACADSGNRYWNALGIGNPFKDDKTIIAEINPPKSGINRRVSGAFIEDGAGNIYLAHRGRVGGGRKGIGKKAFMAWYPSELETVKDGDRYSKMIVIGRIDDENLIESLTEFTFNVVAFKNAAVITS